MTQATMTGSGAATRVGARSFLAAGGLATTGKSRRTPRVAHRATCRVTRPEFSPAVEIAGETRDLSRDGLSVVLSQTIPTGVLLEAHFYGPDGAASSVRGRVVYCRRVLAEQFELGISLVSPN